MKPEGVDAYPLSWPLGWPRTRNPKSSNFTASFARVRDSLFAQIKLLGGTPIPMATVGEDFP